MERARLKAARLRQCWTLEEAAKQLGIDKNTLNRLELGKANPRPYTIRRLCEIYKTTPVELDLDTGEYSSPIEEEPDEVRAFIQKDLTMLLMKLAFVPYRSYQDLQAGMTATIEEFDVMNIGEEANITRRDALCRVVALPFLSLHLSASQPVFHGPIQDILNQCAAGIAAAWELSKGGDDGDLTLAFQSASTYLPTLKAIVKDSSQYRQTAASLVGQCELLRTLLGWHLQGLKEAAIYANDAIAYCEQAGDISMLLSTLDYLAWAYYYDKKSQLALKTIGRTLPIMKKYKGPPLSGRLLGGIYSTIALMKSRNGEDTTDEVEKAATSFYDDKNPDERFIHLDYTEADLILNRGMIQYHSGDYDNAVETLEGLIDPETLVVKLVLPERSRLEGLNIMTLASLKSRKKDLKRIIHLWNGAMGGAKAIQSEQRYSEAILGHEIMEAIWPNEHEVKKLRTHAAHW